MLKKKSLGQNFLLDQNISRKIVSNLTQNGNNEEILEIGPGLGNLTVTLCKNHSIKKIILVEKDKDFEKALCKLKLQFSKKILVYFTDFMHFDLNILSKNAKIVGNLPYNLATHFIKNFIEQDNFLYDFYNSNWSCKKNLCKIKHKKLWIFECIKSDIFWLQV